MTTTGKTARELQVMIMGKLRVKHPECDDVIAVLVTPAGGSSRPRFVTPCRLTVSVRKLQSSASYGGNTTWFNPAAERGLIGGMSHTAGEKGNLAVLLPLSVPKIRFCNIGGEGRRE